MLFIKFSLSDNLIFSAVLQVVENPSPQGTSVPMGETGLKTNINNARANWRVLQDDENKTHFS